MYLQRWHGWCHMKLQPCRRKSCIHHTTMLHVTSCKATDITVYACLAVTCHLHFWQNDQDLLCANAVKRGWNGYPWSSYKSTLTDWCHLVQLSSQLFNQAVFLLHSSGYCFIELNLQTETALEYFTLHAQGAAGSWLNSATVDCQLPPIIIFQKAVLKTISSYNSLLLNDGNCSVLNRSLNTLSTPFFN